VHGITSERTFRASGMRDYKFRDNGATSAAESWRFTSPPASKYATIGFEEFL
jgi:hypothetical protein